MESKVPSESNSNCTNTYAQVQAYSLFKIDIHIMPIINLKVDSKHCKGRAEKSCMGWEKDELSWLKLKEKKKSLKKGKIKITYQSHNC